MPQSFKETRKRNGTIVNIIKIINEIKAEVAVCAHGQHGWISERHAKIMIQNRKCITAHCSYTCCCRQIQKFVNPAALLLPVNLHL